MGFLGDCVEAIILSHSGLDFQLNAHIVVVNSVHLLGLMLRIFYILIPVCVFVHMCTCVCSTKISIWIIYRYRGQRSSCGPTCFKANSQEVFASELCIYEEKDDLDAGS